MSKLSNKISAFSFTGTRNAFWALCLIMACMNAGCYSFKGISIDPRVNTFNVQIFENQASNAPQNMAIEFTEKLKDKIRTETRLTLKNENPDAEFSGAITDFRVSPVAPKPGEVVALNRLEIKIKVNYANNIDEKKGWPSGRDFSFFEEFSSDKDLLSIQNQLIDDISKQLLEDVFNAAFNDW